MKYLKENPELTGLNMEINALRNIFNLEKKTLKNCTLIQMSQQNQLIMKNKFVKINPLCKNAKRISNL